MLFTYKQYSGLLFYYRNENNVFLQIEYSFSKKWLYSRYKILHDIKIYHYD